MRSRPRLLLSVAVAGAAVAIVLAGGAWLLWPRTAITRENAAKLKAGMTLAEVEAILGGPGQYELAGRAAEAEPAARAWDAVLILGFPPGATAAKRWDGEGLAVRVFLDEGGRVAGTQCLTIAVYPLHETPLDRLRRWLGL